MDTAAAVWRVYVPEWLTAYTSHAKGDAGKAECEGWLEDFARTMGEHPTQVQPCSTRNPGRWEYKVLVRAMNRKGEYRERPDADHLAAELGEEAVVVERYSRQESAMLRRQRW